MKNKGYTLYLFYNDIQIGKYKMIGDDFNKLYKSFGERILREGFMNGKDIKTQTKTYKQLCDTIYKQKNNCEKIRASDYLMFLSCYINLVKFNLIDYNDFIFLKNK
tara:strand:- start:177 stop:494 length:318 start_codon:yes stop_codon:yes gene_type:complete